MKMSLTIDGKCRIPVVCREAARQPRSRSRVRRSNRACNVPCLTQEEDLGIDDAMDDDRELEKLSEKHPNLNSKTFCMKELLAQKEQLAGDDPFDLTVGRPARIVSDVSKRRLTTARRVYMRAAVILAVVNASTTAGYGVPGYCTNTCGYASDGACDDGGPGSEYSGCDRFTDCLDCCDSYDNICPPMPPAAPPPTPGMWSEQQDKTGGAFLEHAVPASHLVRS